MAPEVWVNNDLQPDDASDIWSMGVMLYQLCALDYPFKPDVRLSGPGAEISLQRAIVERDYEDLPAHYSVWVHQLVDCMLKKDASQRPKA